MFVKPDGVRRGLVGEIVGRIERKGLAIVAMKMLTVEESIARRHYAEHGGRPFFNDLISFITSGPVVAMIVEGEEAVSVVRTMMGATDPKKAAPGTIRGDLAIALTQNLVHGSDSATTAMREMSLLFPELG